MASRKKQQQNRSKVFTPKPEKPDKEQLINEALTLYAYKSESDISLETSDFCYMISENWWQSIQNYLSYDEVIEDKPLKKAFGQKKPGKINEGILNHPEKILEMPKESEYLNIFVNGKILDKEEYIIVDEKLWIYLESIYGGIQIKRPLVKEYGDYSCDELFRSHLIFFDSENITKIKSMNENEFSDYSAKEFYFKTIQIPSKWKPIDLMIHLQEVYIKNYKEDNENLDFTINIWKLNNYVYLDQFKTSLHSFSISLDENKTYEFPGKLINNERFNDLYIDEFLKQGYYLVVEIKSEVFQFVEKVLTKDEKSKINGYCETCNKENQLHYKCTCDEVFYCQQHCKYKDKRFHNTICTVSYDSSSDEEPSSFNEYTNYKGLENVGNTCYMNAALQCIAQCDFIKKIYLNQQFLDVLKKKSTDGVKFLLTKKFARFIRKLSASLITETFAPYSLKEIFAFYHPSFKGFSQHDSQEFLSFLLTALHEEISIELNKNPFDFNDPYELMKNIIENAYSDIALETYGLYSSKIKCPSCQNCSIQYEMFSILPLPIPNPEDVYYLDFTIVFKDFSLPSIHQYIKLKGIHNNISDIYRLITPYFQFFIPAIVSEDGINEILKTDIKITELKNKLFSKKDRLVFYEIQQNNELEYISIDFFSRINHSEAGLLLRNSIGIQRILSISPEEGFYGLYKLILECFNGIWPNLNQILTDLIKVEEEKAIEENLKKLEIKEELKIQPEIEEKKNNKNSKNQKKIEYIKPFETPKGPFRDFLNSLPFKLKTQRSHKNCFICKKKHCDGCEIPLENEILPKEVWKNNKEIWELEIFIDNPPDIILQGLNNNKGGNINKTPTLDNCLDLFSEEETLSKENQWFCDNCKEMKQAEKKMELFFSSKYMILQLKRFKSLGKGKKVKNNQAIEYIVNDWDLTDKIKDINPMFLRSEGNNINSEKEENKEEIEIIKEKKIIYDLKGIILHEGKVDEGHYIAYCKIDGKWKKFDDSKVSDLEEKEIVTRNAYILFYELKR